MSESTSSGVERHMVETMMISSSADTEYRQQSVEKAPSDPLEVSPTDPLYPASTKAFQPSLDDQNDDEPKEIVTLMTMSANGTAETNEADSILPEVQRVNSPKAVEIVQISNADSSNETPGVSDHLNRSERIANVDEDDEEEEPFEMIEIIEAGDTKSEGALSETNNTSDVPTPIDGNADSTTVKQERNNDGLVVYQIREIAESQKTKSTSLNQDQIKKIALEQIRSMDVKKRSKAKSSSTSGASLITSLVMDWSDNENNDIADSPPESVRATSIEPPKPIKPVEEEKIKVVPKPVILNKIVTSESPTKPVKSQRVIKKKIIWDPDAPETQFSYASLLKAKAGETSSKKRKTIDPRVAKDPPPLIQQPTIEQTVEKPKPVATKSKLVVVKKLIPAPSTAQVSQPTVRILNIGKRHSVAPTASESKRKRVSEIDKLLADEGAANMLQNLDLDKPMAKESRARKVSTPAVVVTAKTTAAKKEIVAAKKDVTPKKETTKKEITTTPKKRVPRQSPSTSWDYVYNQRNVDSLIIRRRSNSSYSSTSPRRQSIETKSNRGQKSRSFEFVRPNTKRSSGKQSVSGSTENLIVEDIKSSSVNEATAAAATGRKSNRTPVQNVPAKISVTPAGGSGGGKQSNAKDEKHNEQMTIKRHGNVVQLILKPKIDRVQNSFTSQLMDEVVRQLELLKADNDCRVVVITSAGPSFCQGIDIMPLTQGNVDKRRNTAQDLANTVTTFLKSLLGFPKPLIAGIVGSCSGIGVTMLPVFDVVISSDKSTFETSYAKAGQLPEGNCLLASTNNVRHSFKIKLLWLCEKLNSTEAALSGLVTKLTAPSKVIDEALQCAKQLAAFSQQSLVSIKSQRHDVKKLNATLQEEQKILLSQWQSAECQEKFKHFITKGSW